LDVIDILFLQSHENLIRYSSSTKQNNNLPVEKSTLVDIPAQNIQVFTGVVMFTLVFNHALTQANGILGEGSIQSQEAFCASIMNLYDTDVRNIQFQRYIIQQVFRYFADTICEKQPIWSINVGDNLYIGWDI
jgi:hypothetical protein